MGTLKVEGTEMKKTLIVLMLAFAGAVGAYDGYGYDGYDGYGAPREGASVEYVTPEIMHGARDYGGTSYRIERQYHDDGRVTGTATPELMRGARDYSKPIYRTEGYRW